MGLESVSQELLGRPIFAAFAGVAREEHARVSGLREELNRVGYDDRGVCRILGVASAHAIDPAEYPYYDRIVLSNTPLADLVRLFILAVPLDDAALSRALSPGSRAMLVETGALVRRGDSWQPQIHLVCAGDLLLATDTGRYSTMWPEGQDMSDRVMLPGGESTGLVHVAPVVEGGRTLDVCCGGGVHGLAAAAVSRDVVGVDVNPRAVRFARFNAALNGVTSACFLSGDLFAPVADERFDTIIANPPFIATPPDWSSMLYRDGGPAGDDVLRRILAEGPTLLVDGGYLAVVAHLVNLAGFEARLRAWWTDNAPPADVLVLVEQAVSLPRYTAGHVAHVGDAGLRRRRHHALLDHYRATGIDTIHAVYILVRRSPAGARWTYRVLDAAGPITRPVSRRVQGHFEVREALRVGVRTDAVIELAADVGFRTESWIDGATELRRSELFARGDDFIPTLELSESAHEVVRVLRTERLRWSQVAGSAAAELIEDLLLRGVLCLSYRSDS
jgi:carbamoyltransferase